MMDEDTLFERSFELIRKDFGLVESVQDEAGNLDFEWLLNQLARNVNHLLDTDFNQLMNALYRIDIAESKVSRILEETPAGEIGRAIAQAIIEREKEKVITRQKYRQ